MAFGAAVALLDAIIIETPAKVSAREPDAELVAETPAERSRVTVLPAIAELVAEIPAERCRVTALPAIAELVAEIPAETLMNGEPSSARGPEARGVKPNI